MPSVDLTHFTSMSKQSTPNDQNFDTGEFETGEFERNQIAFENRLRAERRWLAK